jgi:hypothetical protein
MKLDIGNDVVCTSRTPFFAANERDFHIVTLLCAGPLRPLACWVCGFESHRGHGRLSVVSVVYY